MQIVRIVTAIFIGLFELIAAALEAVAHCIAGTLAILRVHLHKDYDYKRWLKRDLADCRTILELGCGANSPLLQIGYGLKTTSMDMFQPYIDKHNRAGDYHKCFPQDILTYDFPVKLYDAVVITDVMEHLDRKTVINSGLFEKMERCAIKKVIIFTPNGFVENDEVDGDPWQRHISAWEPVDYARQGYKVRGATGLRYILGKASLPKYHPYSVFAIIAMLSQPIIFNNPELAWHSYAVKEIKN